MTNCGALNELNNLLKADDIPIYYKPSIKAVMDTIRLSSSEKTTSAVIKNDLAVEKIIDEIEKEFEKVDIPIMDKLSIFAKIQNALYKCAESNLESVDE